ncbi:NTP/NDP exchange transporter [Pseudoxanthomonas sp. GW2]|uniref:NTP/NDP exchange transporter n=1 Tax=Pseudoxanthomonas sp. GW2 TaxID=1211114 RepID=UPI00030C31C6|nr:MFS transporter [Pseudoxanthomonas sp. GW2]
MTSSPDSARRQPLLSRLFGVQPHEAPAVGAGLAMFFLLFTGYFMLRPVRETFGVAGGVDNLQWLFTGTFLATVAVLPVFGWIASKVPRRRIVPWVFGAVVATLLGFGASLLLQPENVWVGRAFYIWVSVVNLLLISLAWSVLADVFAPSEARRLFALVASGASAGGLLGPVLTTLLVGTLGHGGLLLLSSLLIGASAATALWLHRWRVRHPLPAHERAAAPPPKRLGGNPFEGATDVFRSPFLLGICLFVVLLTTVTTFLYFEQARLVAELFPHREQQTRVFGLIDTVVQVLAILTQLFVTGHVARKLGVGVLLVAVPLVMAAGFLWLALAPVFAVFVVVMVARRAGEYALVRPGREMLYTVVPAAQKYKAKNFIDTAVYRGGDALSAWVKRMLDLLGEHPSLALFIGAGVALVWAGTGVALGRAQRRREAAAQ